MTEDSYEDSYSKQVLSAAARLLESMTETDKMAREMSAFLRLLGDEPLKVPAPNHSLPELEFLRILKQEYTRRLLHKVPKYRAFASEALIPDMFLDALRRREAELEAGNG